MDRKDIALTVGGVIASAAITYLIYRMQQRDNASTADTATASDNSTITDPYASLPTMPSFNFGGSSDNTSSSGAVSTASPNTMIADILASFHADQATPTTNPFESLLIPVQDFSSSPLSDIPTTLDEVNNGVSTVKNTTSTTVDATLLPIAVNAPTHETPSTITAS